jgi:membrane-bound lytic murein transglycosylase MltF
MKLTLDQVKKLVADNNKSVVSTELLVCLIWKESGFDPDIVNSGSTATGLMQMTVGAVADVNANTPKGVHFEHSEMKDPAKNIQCGSYYVNARIKRVNGNIAAGLNGFGTGPGYADNILTCETCLKKASPDPQKCLNAIHT